MRFLVKKTPDNFIKSVNDGISSILNRHFDDMYPEYGYDEIDKLTMPVEITDKEKEYDIRAELPGVKKEDLDIDVEKNYITIRAKKEEESKEDSKSYKKSEFKYGEFARTIYIPQEINIEKTEAKLEHGVLKIQAPKLYETKESTKKLIVK